MTMTTPLSSTKHSQTIEYNHDGVFARIEYRVFDIKSLQVVMNQQALALGGVRLEGLVIDGEPMGLASRFSVSFATLLKQSPTIFSLFSVDEVVSRALSKHTITGNIQIAIDRTEPGKPVALACAPENRSFLNLAHLNQFREEMKGLLTTVGYDKCGTLKFRYDLSRIHRPFSVFGTEFSPTLDFRVSVDGWGRPAGWLGVNMPTSGRQLIALSDAFRSYANLGAKEGAFSSSLARFIRSFSNEDGVVAIENRLARAEVSRASLGELLRLEKAAGAAGLPVEEQRKVADIVAHENNRFGLTSLSVIPEKRARRAPTDKTLVNELLMLATEMASKAKFPDALYEWVGRMLGDPSGYDLEGSGKQATKAHSTDHTTVAA